MITIIIPAYNCTKTLHRTLGSLVAQTDSRFKVLIIDDCSTEDLNPIINLFKPLLDIEVIRNETNMGCGMSRQTGIDNATSDYIAFLDSDDVLMPYTVETWCNMTQKSPQTDIFHSYIYEQKIINNTPYLMNIEHGYTYTHGKLYKLDFIQKYGIRNDARIIWADDSFFNSMCTELGKVSVIPIATYVWLDNQESITRCGKLKTQEALLDFINAMIISTEFVRSKGIKTISHAPQTMMLIENSNIEFTSEMLNKYNKLKKIFKGE